MNEVFDSENISIEYKKDDNVVLVVLKGRIIRDDFRTSMMRAADMVMRHSCKIMTVDFKSDPEMNESDINRIKKILLSNLKKSGLETIIFVDSCSLETVGKYVEFCKERFNTIVCKSYEEGMKMLEQEGGASGSDKAGTDNSANDKIALMTREEALEYMGLKQDADIKEIDDRFWQMSKLYRGKNDGESLKMEDEISAVYDIASGRRDRRLQEEKRHESEPVYFGRYKSDWKNIIHYNWKNWLLGAAVVISALVVLISFLTNTKSDCSVVVFGHINFDNTFMCEALEAQGLRRPYVASANVVVPNNENISYQEYGNETFNALFYTNPDVLISDEKAYLYYFSTFRDLTPLYDRIVAGLSEEARNGIRPVYMTEQESVERNNEMHLEYGLGDIELEDPSLYSDEPVMIGIEITDPQLANKLGVDVMWKSGETTLIFGQCMSSKNDDQTVLVITTLINAAFS